jgi:hypothetical protein
MIIAPVIAFFISTDSTPISVNGIFCLVIASTSAYDILASSLSVTVTADVRGVRESVAVLGVCAGPFLVAAMAVLGLGAPVILAGVAAVAPFFVTSEASVFSCFFFSVFLLLLGSTTLHSSPPCSLGGATIWMARGVAEWSALFRGSGMRGRRPPNHSSIALIIMGPSSFILFSSVSMLLLSLWPVRGGGLGKRAEPSHRGHPRAQAGLCDNSWRRAAFSSSADSLAFTSLADAVPLLCPGSVLFAA